MTSSLVADRESDEAVSGDVPAGRLWCTAEDPFFGRRRDDARLLVVSRSDAVEHDTTFAELGRFLRPGDVLVVNTSATLPAAVPTGNGRRWPLDAYQTVFATEAGSAEMPSAGRGFTAELVTSLVAGGVLFAPIVLHCGVSSPETGGPPRPERYRVPATTAALVNAARAAGGRVVAVGTTATRALETTADEAGVVHPGEGWTDLVITPGRGVRAVDGLITGWHEPEASHLQLIEAVVGRGVLERSYAVAADLGYQGHESGDFHLMLP